MASAGTFRVGFAKAEITPPLSVPYLSWRPRHAPFASVHDPLFVRAVVVETESTRIAIASADLIGLAYTLLGPDRSFISEIRRACGLDAAHLLLAATHSHATPDTLDFRPLRAEPGALQWLESLPAIFASAVNAAAASLAPAQLSVHQTDVPGLSINRRNETDLDTTFTTLQFTTESGKRILLTHFACHPVIVQVQPQVSADFPGALCAILERDKNVLGTLFLQGASGDINPACGDSKNFADVSATAERLAAQIKPLHRAACCHPERSEGSIRETTTVRVRDSSLPLGMTTTIACAHNRIELPSRTLNPADMPPHMRDEFDARAAEGTSVFLADLQAIRLGPVLLLSIPGEAFCSLALALRDAARPLTGLTLNCANGYLGYFVPPRSWPRGGYETLPGPWSKCGPEAHGILLDAMRSLIRQLNST